MTDKNEHNQDNGSAPAPRRRRGRLTLVALILVFTTPWIFSLLWRPDGRVNFGTLVTPVKQVVAANLRNREGKPVSTDDIREKWVWLTVTDGLCSEACQANLYTMRQTRLAAGKNTKRIRYALLNLNPGVAALADDVVADHPMLDTYRLDDSGAGDAGAAALRDQLTAAGGGASLDSDNTGVYLIDPIGHIILHYPVGETSSDQSSGISGTGEATDAASIDPKDLHKAMKKDVGRLLRGSHVG